MSKRMLMVGNKVVSYEEIPPKPTSPTDFQLYDVTIDGKTYQLATNIRGEAAVTADHAIVRQHRDVVEAIVRHEFG